MIRYSTACSTAPPRCRYASRAGDEVVTRPIVPARHACDQQPEPTTGPTDAYRTRARTGLARSGAPTIGGPTDGSTVGPLALGEDGNGLGENRRTTGF